MNIMKVTGEEIEQFIMQVTMMTYIVLCQLTKFETI